MMGKLYPVSWAALMESTECEDAFGQDSLEVGETMWVFNEKGKALVASISGHNVEASE